VLGSKLGTWVGRDIFWTFIVGIWLDCSISSLGMLLGETDMTVGASVLEILGVCEGGAVGCKLELGELDGLSVTSPWGEFVGVSVNEMASELVGISVTEIVGDID